jgi:radical SAM superfamily enzyme YgiQ (UPF0313 family)
MRVLLVQPDFCRAGQTPDRMIERLLPARSLLELAALLETRGHQVQVLDPITALTRLNGRDTLDLEAALDQMLAEQKFDAVGIAVYTATRREARRLAAVVKRRSRLTKVIVGGPHASHLAQPLMNAWREIDFVCLGAAEDSLPALLSCLSGQGGPVFRVKNIAFRAGPGRVRVTGKPSYHADLSSLPPVRYDRYCETAPGGRIRRAYVMTARGCRHWCNFCSQLWKKVLPAPPAEVAREIRRLVDDCGTEEIIFYDDCFGMDPDHARAVLKAVTESGARVRLQAVTRFDAVREDWLEAFGAAGGVDLLAGLETGSPRLRKRMNKHLAEDELCRGSELVRRFGMRLGVFLMFGFPNEEDKDVRETWRLLRLMGPTQVMSTVFDIKPGDILYEFALASQTITPEAWLGDEPRAVNGMESEALRRSAARAMAFDQVFTREVMLPEHDPAAFTLGLDPAGLGPLIEEEKARWS